MSPSPKALAQTMAGDSAKEITRLPNKALEDQLQAVVLSQFMSINMAVVINKVSLSLAVTSIVDRSMNFRDAIFLVTTRIHEFGRL